MTMDPKATLEMLQEAIRSQNWDEAEWAGQDLLEWVKKQGFLPEPFELQVCLHDIPDISVRAVIRLLEDEGLELTT